MTNMNVRRIFSRFPNRLLFRYRRIVAVLACGIIILLGLGSIFSDSTRSHDQPARKLRVKYVKNVGNNTLACRLPNVDPYHSSILKFIKDLGKLRCEGTNYSSFENNLLKIKGDGFASVEFRTIERPSGDDFNVSLSEPVNVRNMAAKGRNQGTEKVSQGFFWRLWNFFTGPHSGPFLGEETVEAEFIRVDIVTDSGETKSEVHMNVIPKKEVVGRALKPGGIPLDVALVMFDSVSAANFKRKMPNSLEYLTKNLNSILLQGETVVGDGTTPNLSALLTGIAEINQSDARRKIKSTRPVDEWRWIFKDYKQKGYATMFSEDSPHYAAFNYRLHGFRDPPTDHYARPWWLEADPIVDGYCINSRASHEISLSYLLKFSRVYKHRPKFSFISHTEISHNDPNAVGLADDDLKNFLQVMEKELLLNRTFLVIFADHGARFSELRKTIQGKLEERLPFLSITTPKWFSEKYPDLYSNLVHNSHLLTTPYDVYATLRHIVSYPEYPSGITTGQSLFNRIDGEYRTCSNAGVEDHWCTCLNLEEVPIDEPVIRESAELVVNYINSLTSQNAELSKLCHRLDLKEIKMAFRDMPSEAMQTFKDSEHAQNDTCDACVVVMGDKAENTLATDTLYQLQLVTSPNEGFYEASVRVKKGVPSLVGDISRIDAYKDQPYCVQDRYPLLRKYCFCSR